MAKSIFKTALCSSAAIVLPAVPAAVFLPSQASAPGGRLGARAG